MKSLNMHKPKFELSIQVICMFMKCLNMHKKQGFEPTPYLYSEQTEYKLGRVAPSTAAQLKQVWPIVCLFDRECIQLSISLPPFSLLLNFPLENHWCNITFWSDPPPFFSYTFLTPTKEPLPPSRCNNVFERPLSTVTLPHFTFFPYKPLIRKYFNRF